MKKKVIFGLFLLAMLAALAVWLTSTKSIPTSYAQTDVKELRERIRHLEELSAIFEKKLNEKHNNQVQHAAFTPDGKAVITYDEKGAHIWQPQDPKGTPVPVPTQPALSGNPPAALIPPGWKAHEFNGMTYYLVPLTMR